MIDTDDDDDRDPTPDELRTLYGDLDTDWLRTMRAALVKDRSFVDPDGTKPMGTVAFVDERLAIIDDVLRQRRVVGWPTSRNR